MVSEHAAEWSPLSPALLTALADLSLPGKWPLFCTEDDLQTLLGTTIREKHAPSFHPDLASNPAATEEVVRTIAGIVQDLLETRRDIALLSLRSGQRIAIPNPNWLTNELLNGLFRPHDRIVGKGPSELLLTQEQIASALPRESFNTHRPLSDSLRQLLPDLLVHVGVCIPVVYKNGHLYTDAGDEEESRSALRYFPALLTPPMGAADAQPHRDPVEVAVRLYRLMDDSTSILPIGYIASLSADIVSLYPTSTLICPYQNGMVLEMANGLRVIVRGSQDSCSFTLEVELTHLFRKLDVPSAFTEMRRLRELIVNTRSWRCSVPLVEYGLHPVHRQDCAGIPVVELERKLQNGNGLTEEECPFYFGWSGSRRDEDSVTELVAMLRKVVAGAPDLFAEMQSPGHDPLDLKRLTSSATKDATISLDGDDATAEDLREAEHYAQQVSVQQLAAREGSQADQARQLTARTQQRESAQLQAASDNHAAAIDTLDHLRHSAEGAGFKTGPVTDGVFDIPLLPVLTDTAGPTSLTKLKSLLYRNLCLNFVCPVCARTAASGPRGKGYELTVTRQWIHRHRHTIAAGLRVLSVLSLVSPLPLPGLGDLSDYLPDISAESSTAQDIEGQLETSPGASAPPLVRVRIGLEYATAVREMLLAAGEDFPPRRTGLVRVVCRDSGECAWVCDREEGRCRAAFQEHGTACQAVQMIFC